MNVAEATTYLLKLKGKQVQYDIFQIINPAKLEDLIDYITLQTPTKELTELKKELQIIAYLIAKN